MPFQIRPMQPEDVPQVVGLQKLAFPPPFSEDLHWDPEHLLRHIDVFPAGQFVAEADGKIVGSCSNAIISEKGWQAHGNWGATMGGPFIRYHDPAGSTLYGLDITVHPQYRRMGVGRGFYEDRYSLVRSLPLTRYGTGCRMPDYRNYFEIVSPIDVETYAQRVAAGEVEDRTLTPLLRYGLRYIGVIRNYMEDVESANAGALLEWTP